MRSTKTYISEDTINYVKISIPDRGNLTPDVKPLMMFCHEEWNGVRPWRIKPVFKPFIFSAKGWVKKWTDTYIWLENDKVVALWYLPISLDRYDLTQETMDVINLNGNLEKKNGVTLMHEIKVYELSWKESPSLWCNAMWLRTYETSLISSKTS